MTKNTAPNAGAPEAVEEHGFKAEVNQVLDIVINSLYSNPEIFLRELISNSADALDKLRFEALTTPELKAGEEDLEIQIVPDAENGTLTIIDTGIGMTRDELVQNLGTIAHSGSKKFLEAIKDQAERKDDVDLIGRFGVGFYSSFLVADKTEVRTLSAREDAEGHRWTSTGEGTFTVEADPAWTTRGTAIILHLKDDKKEFLAEHRIRELVRRWSDFVSWPILLEVERKEDPEKEDSPLVKKDERINTATAVWRRPRKDVTAEEYEEFYKHISHDWEKPLDTIHFSIEGTHSYTGLLFVPTQPPFDLNDRDRQKGVRLYVKRVLIMEECKELVPEYLRFLRGVIDSEDLPLNVSRELLQEDAIVRSIKKTLVSKTLASLEYMANENPEDYAKFWKEFGIVLKEGLHFDKENSERLAKLVRWPSSKSDSTSLADYVGRMQEGQDEIYYAFGHNRSAVEGGPHIEALKKHNREVLFMTDPIDEWALDGLREFEGKKLVSAMRADLNLDSEEDAKDKKAEEEANKERFEDLTAAAQKILDEHVSEVRISKRLTDSPVCLVVPEHGLHAHIERMMRAQGQALPETKRILEINPDHKIIEKLHLLNAEESTQPKVSEWMKLLYDQALLAEGSPISDPQTFARRVSELMTDALEGEASA